MWNQKAALAVVAFSCIASASAQVFTQSFDAVGAEGGTGPANLVAQGWEFRRVLDPGVVHDSWRQGPWHAGQPAAWEGTGFLAGLETVPPFGSGNFVEWIILPPVAGQSAGQAFSAWVRGMSTSTFPIAGSVQVRYSPSGGTSTGTSPTSVGDFTQMLDENSNGSLTQWEELQGTIPGAGRLAIRWVGNLAFSFSGTSADLLIDSLVISEDSMNPPLPQPGETVHWTPAMSPIHLISQQVVPADATLIVDAGVEIYFDFNTPTFGGSEMVTYGGTIRFDGTDAAPVVIRRGANSTRVPSIGAGSGQLVTLGNSGRLEANFVNADVSIGVGQSALFVCRDSTISRDTPIDWASDTDLQWQVPKVTAGGATAIIENCTFTNAVAEISDAVFRIEGCTFDDGQLRVTRFPIAQAGRIANNTFRNTTERAPIELDGYDFLLGPGNVIENCYAPLSLRGAGLTPDSTVPAVGNALDCVLFTGSANAEDIVGPMTLPPMSVPYRLWAGIVEGQQYDPRVSCLAGTTIEMDPDTYLSFVGGARFEVLGTPEAPVRFVQSVPGSPWITFQTVNNPPLIVRNGIFDGGVYGVGGGDTLFTVHDCVFSNNTEGVRSGDYCGAIISKSRFVNNGIGIHSIWGGTQGPSAEGVFWEYGAANVNAFEGNGQGVAVMPPALNTSWMQDAWWDSPTGPASPNNPGGTGQSASAGVDVLPYRTTPVDFNDHPPVVRVKQVAYQRQLRLGTKIILHWEARDDGSIVSQRLENLPVNGFRDPVTVIPDIPPGARSVELTITPDGQAGQVYRVVSVDDAGQEGFDDYHLSIGEDNPLQVAFLTDLSGGYRIGENFDVATTLEFPSDVQLHIDDLLHDMQPRGVLGLEAIFNVMPAVSTDLARYAVFVGNEPHYSPYFSIRPQVGFGDDPPTIAMTSPVAGATYLGGSVVPIAWSSSDDHGLRSFDLQASYDGGESWHLFAGDLPGTVRSYDWQLPASTGIADVRVRVIARDTQFQVTSDGTNRVISITPGDWPSDTIPGDVNDDGHVDLTDLAMLLSAFGACVGDAGFSVGADFDNSGCVDLTDLATLLGNFGI